MFHSRMSAAVLALGALALLSACSTVSRASDGVGGVINSLGTAITPYKIEVVQGNVLTKEQVSALQKGMSKEQVRGILGSPLITSAFHADRWDYAFTIERQGIADQERRYTVTFKGDLLDTFVGDAMPSEVDFVASLVGGRTLGKAPALAATEDQLKNFASANARKAAPAAPASSPVRTDYPPLEAAVGAR
jgi:outer membrane protein assembly factor BamE